MLERTFESGKSLEDFLTLARIVKAQAMNPMMSRFRLTFTVAPNGDHTNEEILESFHYDTLRSWLKMEKMFKNRTIQVSEVKTAAKNLRKAALNGERYGKFKP
jgi:hypothetical protein